MESYLLTLTGRMGILQEEPLSEGIGWRRVCGGGLVEQK